MPECTYYIHDEGEVFRLEIHGNLTGAGVRSVEQAWRTAHSVLDGRQVVIGLRSVVEADEYGHDLLLIWHRIGARIVARSPESRALAEGIVRGPIPAAKPGWRQRLSLLLRRSLTAATKTRRCL